MLSCPRCKEFDYHRSHAKTDYERLRKIIFKQRKYRCHSCGYVGWEKSRSLDKRSVLKTVFLYATVILIAMLVGILSRSFLM
ncbi:hypothetical protein JXB12_04040 [candidate division KSB1 bacterium]|nr:hypothetical protein [candidate division KSB1 bacterium]